MNPRVDFYFDKVKKWQDEIQKMRTLVLDCQLTEELKWGVPCYTLNGNNIILIHTFKDYCAFLFFKGVLLADAERILVQQTLNVQSGRQIRFTNLLEIVEMESILRAYIYEAIEVENAGLKVELKKTEEFVTPIEFQRRLDGNEALKIAFEALTPGRQRAYKLYFSSPKQSKTREVRVENYISEILNGRGLHD